MSFGTNNNQPFNPTAGMNGPLGQVPGMVMKSLGNAIGNQPGGSMPGAQDPNQQQYFQKANQSHQELGQALQNMQGIFGGGKGGGGGGGGKYTTGPVEGHFGQPSLDVIDPGFNVDMPYGQPANDRPWLNGKINY